MEGSYFAGSNLTGPELTLQKDLVVGLVADLPHPYSGSLAGQLCSRMDGRIYAHCADARRCCAAAYQWADHL